MIVFRIENEYGEGPYNNRFNFYTRHGELSPYGVFRDCLAEVGFKFNNRGILNHQAPNKEGIRFERGKHVFGFSSYGQLKYWFARPVTMKIIEDAGFYITVYENVTDVIFGETQVAFTKTEQFTRYEPTVAGRNIARKYRKQLPDDSKLAA